MKVGFFFADLRRSDGGVYTFENDILRALGEAKTEHELVIINAGQETPQLAPHISQIRVDIQSREGYFGKILRKFAEPWVRSESETNRRFYPLRRLFPVQRVVKDHAIE